VGAGRDAAAAAAANPRPLEAVDRFSLWTSTIGIALVVVTVLGGIWFGYFTPTEGAGAGAFIALVLGIVKGMRLRQIVECILSVGRTSAPILILLVTASLYARTLAMTGVTSAIQDTFLQAGLTPALILLIMIGIWFVLGMMIDSISIMLLTVIIFEPIAVSVGFDSIAFAVIGVLAIEAGLLTPPFGILVYTVRSAIDDRDISIWDIFAASTPYWVVLLTAVVLVAIFPGIATFLPLGFLTGWVASFVLRKLNLLRMPPEVELEGLDVSEYEEDLYIPEMARLGEMIVEPDGTLVQSERILREADREVVR
jgi:C4-dicarboxylate transporter, DctM subunit